MDILNSILLQEQTGGGLSGMLMIVAMIVIFYFFMIRPQNKKQKEIKKAREAMQTGDKVVTAGGIHGKIKDVNDLTLIIEIAPGVTIKVDKSSVYPYVEPEKSAKK
jgi:preprotein translocase, YajC subunit